MIAPRDSAAAGADPSAGEAGPLLVEALDPKSGLPRRYPLKPSADGRRCVVTLEVPPGASALRLPVYEHVRRVLNLEVVNVDAMPGRNVRIAIELVPGATPRVEPMGSEAIRYLSRRDREPPPKLLDWDDGAPLDMVILVDGTCEALQLSSIDSGRANPTTSGAIAVAGRDGSDPGQDGRWLGHVRWLVEVCRQLAARHSDLRLGVLAFGDSKPTGLSKASGLMSRYVLHPAEGLKFEQEWNEKALTSLLLGVPATSGGDYVDALADALAACAERISSRPGARKLLLLTGDSPGYSILQPPGTLLVNAQPRRHDVESATRALHDHGVEIATVFQRAQIHEKLRSDERMAGLLLWTEAQYRTIASRPDLAIVDASAAGETRSPDPEVLVGALARPSPPILARGPSLGIWPTVTPGP